MGAEGRRSPAHRSPTTAAIVQPYDGEVDIVWREPPESFTYVRELVLVRRAILPGGPVPRLGYRLGRGIATINGRLVAYAVHDRPGRRPCRLWYVGHQDPYPVAGPAEAVIPASIRPGLRSWPYELVWGETA